VALPQIDPYHLPEPDQLPANVASWTVDPRRAVLLVHDMQNYFLRPFPAGHAPANELIPRCSELIRSCRDSGVPVIYTAQPGAMSPTERGLLADFWGPGMSADPTDRAVLAELAPAEGEQVLIKWRPSAFVRTELLELLRRCGRDQLVICGVYAHVGILMTAAEACAHDIQPFLVGDAVADFSWSHHRRTLQYAATRCAMVVPAGSVCAALLGAPV
jgi:trans-2,3-dihydro-3-hydroxyanthranilic acid synthase